MTGAIVPTRSATVARRTRPRRNADWLRNQLPMGMLEDDFLFRYLGILQKVADSFLEHVDNLEHAFDPSVAPMPMVRQLGSWIGVDLLDAGHGTGDGSSEQPIPDVDQRRIVAATAKLLAWRGTEKGVRGLLELVTNAPVEIHDSGGVYPDGQAPCAAAHIVVRAQQLGFVEEADLLEIVQHELPASVTFELYVADQQLWPPPPAPEDDESAGDDSGSEDDA